MNVDENVYEILSQTQRSRVSDGQTVPVLSDCASTQKLLVLVLPQLGDFDSLEYAWWLQREQEQLQSITLRAVAIGDVKAGQKFCEYTGFNPEHLFVDTTAKLHQQLNLYEGLTWKLPGFSPSQNAWMNLMVMCAGIGSPGTLPEVFRGYWGDRNAPQLIAPDEVVEAKPLPPIKGATFDRAGGSGFQRPFELATLRLRNMAESLSHWKTYVPDATYLTQRGGTFLFDGDRQLVYEHRDRGILGFSKTMANPLSFVSSETK